MIYQNNIKEEYLHGNSLWIGEGSNKKRIKIKN